MANKKPAAKKTIEKYIVVPLYDYELLSLEDAKKELRVWDDDWSGEGAIFELKYKMKKRDVEIIEV